MYGKRYEEFIHGTEEGHYKEHVMKSYYKINEISKMYNIGVDSIRYYEEIGILHPKRAENGYRQYTTNDIHRLNIIRDLRSLGFSMPSIKEYLEQQSIASSLSFMEKEEHIIDEKIKELLKIKESVQIRKQSLQSSMRMKPHQIEMIHFPIRKCVALKSNMERDDTDYQLIKLSKEYEKNLFLIGNFNTGYFLDIQDEEDIHPYSVFICGDHLESYEFLLPEGDYLCFYYKGKRDSENIYIKQMLKYCKDHHYEIDGYVMEFFVIDDHETRYVEEFITQLQIKIKH